MHPVFGQPGRLVAYVIGSMLVGLFLAGALTRQGLQWVEALTVMLPASLVYAFVCLSAFYVCLAAPLRTSHVTRVLASSGLAAAIASTFWLLIVRVWYAVLDVMPGGGFDSVRLAPQIPFLFTAGVLLFLLSLAVHYVMLAFDAARDAERRQLHAEVLARDAELAALRAQIDPHFLYNSLNSINALTSTDPAGARRMCLMLGDFLRQTLSVGSQAWIPLADELALAERFLDIEQVRFGARLRVERRADEAACGCLVPPLLLQPLVENAVTHGIAHLLDGGVVRLEVARHNGIVSIAIENPRDTEVRLTGPGLGLQNVRRRIAAQFGEQGRMDARAGEQSFRVELNVPCNTAHD